MATGYVAVLREKDGSFALSEHIHSTGACVMASFDDNDDREVIGFFPMTIFWHAKAKYPTAAEVKAANAEAIADMLRKVEAGELKGFGAMVRDEQ